MLTVNKSIEMVDRTYNKGPDCIINLKSPNRVELDIADKVINVDEYELLPIKINTWPVEYVVDVGCNIGAFTTFVKSLWSKTHVLAMDPSPVTKLAFIENTKKLNNIFFHETAAVNTTDEYVHLAITHCTPAGWIKEIQAKLLKNKFSGKERGQYKVKASKVSDLLTSHCFPYIDILKIDAETAEIEVLKDLIGTGWLSRTGSIRIEWHGEEVLEYMHKIAENDRIHVWAIERGLTMPEGDIGYAFGYVWDERYRNPSHAAKDPLPRER
jgi:FkbM family methyltransferase